MVTVGVISGIAGSLLSMAFKYIPPFRKWFDTLGPNIKRLWMIFFLFLACLLVLVLACTGVLANLNWGILTCDQEGVGKLISLFLYAAAGNQTAFLLAPNVKK